MKDTNLVLEAEITASLAKKYGGEKAIKIHKDFVNKHFDKYYLNHGHRKEYNLSTIGEYQSHQARMFVRYASFFYGINKGE